MCALLRERAAQDWANDVHEAYRTRTNPLTGQPLGPWFDAF